MHHISSFKANGSYGAQEVRSAKRANKSGPCEAGLVEIGMRKSCALQAAPQMSTTGARIEHDDCEVLRLRASPILALHATTY